MMNNSLGNSFGSTFRITTFGESHGPVVGVVIDGCPAGLVFNVDNIHDELKRRRPQMQQKGSTERRELDQVEVLSGVFADKTLGTPITLITRNQQQQSADYDALKYTFRPGHADYTYWQKFGHVDYRGGGRASARETWSRVAAGALAKQVLKELFAISFTSTIVHEPPFLAKGETYGGIISCTVKNVPAGWGRPVFERLEAALAYAMLSIPSTKGFEMGDGFAMAAGKGSELNDQMMVNEKGEVRFLSNHAGGVLGGISRGDDLFFRVAFKPVSSHQQEQKTIRLNPTSGALENTILPAVNGRHDSWVLPRALPIVEAMAALTLINFAPIPNQMPSLTQP